MNPEFQILARQLAQARTPEAVFAMADSLVPGAQALLAGDLTQRAEVVRKLIYIRDAKIA